MDDVTRSGAGPGKRRAAVACRFCRQRKMRCGNESPQCLNCKSYAQTCVYDRPSKKPKLSSQAEISTLEEQKRKLEEEVAALNRERSAHLTPSSRPATSHLSGDTPSNLETTPVRLDDQSPYSPAQNGAEGKNAIHKSSTDEQEQDNPAQSTVSRILIAANGVSSYHGATSALYEDAPGESEPLHSSSAKSRLPPQWVPKVLMAEASQQKQLEAINFAAGKLDFDGVDPDLGMHLLSLHWNRQHHSFLITYRPAFMRDMACNGPYFSKILLNAIYFGASKFSTRPEVRREPNDARTAGWLYRQRVKDLLGRALDRSEITTIQALLIMTSSLFALGDERSAAWLYAGTAFRMIIDLGLHVDAPMLFNAHRLSSEDIEIRRRVFWGAFVVDKIQSLYQGRPVSIQEVDTNVPIEFQDRFEELEHWSPFAYSAPETYPGSPAYSVSTFTELCKLCIIMNGILNKVYSERNSNQDSSKLSEVQQSLHADLEKWYSALPSHLRFDPSNSLANIPPPHVHSLLAMYNVLLILLHRPFVSDGHLHSTSPSIAIKSFVICATAATKIVQLLRTYDKAFSIRKAPYLISYATYVCATIHVRIAAQRGPGSEAHACLQTCLAVFNENMETNWAVRRAKAVIVNLMKRMGVTLSDGQRTRSPEQSRNEQNRGTSTAYPVTPASMQPFDHAANIVTEPTFVPGHGDCETIAPDLDVDAIIQSFVGEQQQQQQQANGPVPTASGTMLSHESMHPPRQSRLNGMKVTNGASGDYHQQDREQFSHSQHHLATHTSSYDRSLSYDGNAILSANQVPPSSSTPSYDYYALADSSIDDMLFGFNGSALDGNFW